MSLDSVLEGRLQAQRAAKLYRQRPLAGSAAAVEQRFNGQHYLNFCSNDYLGLANDPRVRQAFESAVARWGVGSGASHLVTGHSEAHHQLEQKLADITQRERAVLFSTGYMANLGLVTALADSSQQLLGDKLNHASLVDACQLASAKNQKTQSASSRQFVRYRHCDLADLSRLLQKAPANSLMISDGVFSMDGDIAPLPELAELAKQYQAHMVIDDAHGFGVLGEQGGGSVLAAGLSQDQVPVYMGTLGKAVGGFGAFVAGSESLCEALIQFARPYIYTTALPPAVAAANLASLEIIQQEPSRRGALQTNIRYFRQQLRQLNLPDSVHLLPSATAIQPLIMGDEHRALMAAEQLKQRGLWVSAIRPPTVPKGTARLRITLSAAHTSSQIDQLCDGLRDVLLAIRQQSSESQPS